jgi:hypothetical protein
MDATITAVEPLAAERRDDGEVSTVRAIATVFLIPLVLLLAGPAVASGALLADSAGTGSQVVHAAGGPDSDDLPLCC